MLGKALHEPEQLWFYNHSTHNWLPLLLSVGLRSTQSPWRVVGCQQQEVRPSSISYLTFCHDRIWRLEKIALQYLTVRKERRTGLSV